MKNGKYIFKDRKGIVDVQFNWIFVMVAGITIFLFIISIAISQSKAAEKRSDTLALNHIVTILKDKQQSSDVFSEISFPETDMEFMCDMSSEDATMGGYFTMKISNAQPDNLQNEIIFAPRTMTTDKILVWSKAFTVGFPVGSFIYLTEQDIAFIIYAEENTFSRQLNKSFPENITKIITTDLSNVRLYRDRKIICFSHEQVRLCPDNEDYIMITPAGDLFDYGIVTYHISGRDRESYYMTEAGLFGAIFSDTGAYYECQMSRALAQFEIKRSLTQDRINGMMEDMSSGECETLLQVTLDENVMNMKYPVPVGESSVVPKINSDYARILTLNSRNLNIHNDRLEIDSCPTIY